MHTHMPVFELMLTEEMQWSNLIASIAQANQASTTRDVKNSIKPQPNNRDVI